MLLILTSSYYVADTRREARKSVPSKFRYIRGYPRNSLVASLASTTLLMQTILTDYNDGAAGAINPTNACLHRHPCVHVVFIHRIHDRVSGSFLPFLQSFHCADMTNYRV